MENSQVMFAFAHDLRTHLRTVLTRIQLVQRNGGAQLPTEEQLYLQEAATTIAEVNGLVSAMLAYSDAGSEEGSEDLMDVGLLLQGVLLERKSALAEVGGEVEIRNPVSVSVPARLQNVLKELFVNACKFRDKNRTLRIRVMTRIAPDEIVEISVSDNGLGVGSDYLDKIFSPFQRLNSRDEFPGYGLGLATCRRVAAAWGGTMAASATPGGGLTVQVTAPAKTVR